MPRSGGSGPPRRRQAARALALLSAILFALAVWAWAGGGFRFRIFGALVSVRDMWRPLAGGVVAALLALAADREGARAVFRGVGPAIASVEPRMVRGGPLLAIALATASTILGVTLGSHAAAGADSYGYVSQSVLWSEGRLAVEQPLASVVPWPNARESFAPLGYRPAVDGASNVPTYAPGLPLLMMLMRGPFGAWGPFLVTPLCGGALLLLVYWWTRRIADPIVAAGTTILTAFSPVVLYMLMWPMSDIPVSASWIAALVTAGLTSRRPVLTAILTGIAIAIRPNLAPLAVVPFTLLLYREGRDRASMVAATIRFAVALAPFVAFIAFVNARLYGSPLRSGYGTLSSLYAVEHIPVNVRVYPAWLLEAHGPLVFLFVVGIVLRLVMRRSASVMAAFAFIVLLCACYVSYIPFTEWWFLRFVLPALPLVYFFVVDGVSTATARFGAAVRVAAVTLVVAIMALHGARFAIDRSVLALGEGERRYIDVGRYVATSLPERAVVIAMQHSGSIRYYSGRTTLRYDYLPAEWLDRAVTVLMSMGLHPYVALEDWEEPLFKARFAGQERARVLEGPPFATLDSNTRVRLYDLGGPAVSTTQGIPHVPPFTIHDPVPMWLLRR